LVDATAGRIGFEIPEAVCGASVKAETAMDAAGIVFVGGSDAGDGGSGHGPVYHERLMIRPIWGKYVRELGSGPCGIAGSPFELAEARRTGQEPSPGPAVPGEVDHFHVASLDVVSDWGIPKKGG
jgi:hypothetical protein